MSSVFPDPLSGLFSVRKSQKARRISLRVVSGRLEVVLPRGVSESVVPEVLARHQKWIERHLSGFRDVHHARGAALVPDRICLVALNESFRVEIGDGGAGRVKAENVVVVPQETAHAVVGLRKWLCRVARSFFLSELGSCAATTGLEWGVLRVGMPKTRWGSCSCRGTISLNARLLFLAPSLVRHVVIHELCHLKHPNHGRMFHELLQSFDPLAVIHARQLKYARYAIPMWAA